MRRNVEVGLPSVNTAEGVGGGQSLSGEGLLDFMVELLASMDAQIVAMAAEESSPDKRRELTTAIGNIRELRDIVDPTDDDQITRVFIEVAKLANALGPLTRH